ncbi:Sodium channel protein type 4 subunit alpha A (Voltage-gated sodium channel subunit alpha Nav1.4a) [Durusdinium trenchii]|uniref:Sodium channel protein type 4 subunit alpha A (Voltage-gated sodium channel subunit alpha Nav1.4a) n=1 Tax=Durusdinium trenchii TaxID=1381693 RepID=A0ABP0R7Q8_9DINO
MGGLDEAVQQLVEVQKQQKASYESLERLSLQHREWQSTVEELLQRVNHSVDQAERSRDHFAGEGQGVEQEFSREIEGNNLKMLNEEEKNLQRRPSIFNERTSATFNIKPLKKLVSEALKEASRSRASGRPLRGLRKVAEHIVAAHWFEYVTGLIIFANLITVGIELEMTLTVPEFQKAVWPQVAERIFLFIYFVELVLRSFAGGMQNLKDLWFWMDLFLVALGIWALVLLPIAGGTDLGFERLLVFRGLRLLRLVRALRMVNHFKIMWRLVYGLLTCGQTILSTMALIIISLFVFACVAVELISKDTELSKANEEVAEIVEVNFGSLGKTIMTLFQFVTLDSISAIYFPLITAKPFLVLVFLPILVVVSIGLMNLVTAALVENAMANATAQAEEERNSLKKQLQIALPSLIDLFHELDEDGSGMLTEEELSKVSADILPPRILESSFAEDMGDLFHYLDVDGTGTLSQTEFIEGLLNLCLLELPLSTIQSLKLLRLIRHEVHAISTTTQEMRWFLDRHVITATVDG